MRKLIYFLVLFLGLQSCKSQVLYFEAESKEKNADGTPIDYFTLEYHKDTDRTIFRISSHAEEIHDAGSSYIYIDSSLYGKYIDLYYDKRLMYYTDNLHPLPVSYRTFKELYYPGIKHVVTEEKEYTFHKELKEMDDNQQDLYLNSTALNAYKRELKKSMNVEYDSSLEDYRDDWGLFLYIFTPDALRRVREIDYNKFPKLFRDKYDLKNLKDQIEKKEEERRIQSEKESEEWQRRNREKSLLENDKK